MSTGDDLLIILSGYSSGYKLMRRRMHGYTGPADFSKIKSSLSYQENILRVALSRLKKRGLVENHGGIWMATKKGGEYIVNKIKKMAGQKFIKLVHNKYDDRTIKNRPKNMVISFDIPEVYRKKRNWLRIELVSLGFEQLQKSVWFGPMPLPEEFIKFLDEFKILKYLKFFKASYYDIV